MVITMHGSRVSGAGRGMKVSGRVAAAVLVAGLCLLAWLASPSGTTSPSARGGADGVGTGKLTVPLLLSASAELLEGAGKIVVAYREGDTSKLGITSKGVTDVGVADTLTQADLASHVYITEALRSMFPEVTVVSEEKDSSESGAQEVDPALHADPDSVGLSRFDDAIAAIDGSRGEWEPLNPEDVTLWIDPLDATKEYSEGLTEYVTVMACVAVKGVPVAGVIHKPFDGRTEWAWVGHGHSFTVPQRPSIAEGHTRVVISISHAGKVQEEVEALGAADEEDVIKAAGAGYKVLTLLDNTADIYVHKTKVKKWDVCAGHALLSSMGGRMTNWAGDEIPFSPPQSPVEEVVMGGLLATRTPQESEAAVLALRSYWPS